MIIMGVKKGRFWMVITVVKKVYFWMVIRVVKKGAIKGGYYCRQIGVV